MKKYIVGFLFVMLLFGKVNAQEFNIGGHYSFASELRDFGDYGFHVIGSNIEYKPEHTIFSFGGNIDYFVNYSFSFPVYFQLHFGNEYRVSPRIGGFIMTNKAYGFISGLSIEKQYQKGWFVFLHSSYMKYHRKIHTVDKFGYPFHYISENPLLLFAVGVKKNILN